MQDAVTSLIKNYDRTGRYLDRDALDQLKSYFATGTTRVQAAGVINGNAADLVKQAAMALFDEVPELIRPGGNAYTTRRYAACLRDMGYYLRYATYALVAGNTDVLDERVNLWMWISTISVLKNCGRFLRLQVLWNWPWKPWNRITPS